MFAIPKEASTVLPLRPVAGGFEVLMVKRHPESVFVPECYVFPGGCIDEADCDPILEDRCRNLTKEKAFSVLGDMETPEMALGAWVAGIRETFEETGILLAYDTNGKMVTGGCLPSGKDLHSMRSLLVQGTLSFTEFIVQEDLSLATDSLRYFAHWITPEGLPHRYDVRFFLVPCPIGQEARSDGRELTDHVWIAPREALARYKQREFPMVLPTIMTLRELLPFTSIEQALDYVSAKCISSILTKLTRRKGRIVEIMPDGTVFSPLR